MKKAIWLQFSINLFLLAHLLVPGSHPETADALYGLFNVSLFEGLDVQVALQSILGDHRLDL